MKQKTIDKKIKITIKDVAKEAGVSLATTSYVLNGKKKFSDETKKKVFNAVDKLNYKPSSFAKTMRTGKTKNIGLILPNFQNPYFIDLIKAIEELARNKNYSIILIDSQDELSIEKEGALRLMQLGVDGIIWCPLSNKNSFEKQGKTTPIVTIDRPQEKIIYDCVFSNYEQPAQLIAKHINELNHKSIGIISGPLDISIAKLRNDIILKEVAKVATIYWCVESLFTTELSNKAIKELNKKNITFLIAGNDMIAIGAIFYLKSIGIRVPEDVSIIGFDGTKVSEIVSPTLTTIKQSSKTIGEEAINTLLDRMNTPTDAPKKIGVDVQLVQGNSTIPFIEKAKDE